MKTVTEKDKKKFVRAVYQFHDWKSQSSINKTVKVSPSLSVQPNLNDTVFLFVFFFLDKFIDVYHVLVWHRLSVGHTQTELFKSKRIENHVTKWIKATTKEKEGEREKEMEDEKTNNPTK